VSALGGSDDNLVSAIAAGDEGAFRQICARYRTRVRQVARTITRRVDLADEVTNDTLWAVWRGAGRFRGASEVSTWIIGIARNLSFRALRSQGRFSLWEESTPVPQTHDPWAESEIREWMTLALAELPPAQRAVLEMHYRLGHTCQEVADRVNCPASTVKTRMHHGRRRLRRLLLHLGGLT
jgi:RNA polymerase sigma-70 factor (ECF subfamily)